MPDLTAADLARLDLLAERTARASVHHVLTGAREAGAANYVELLVLLAQAGHRDIPALVATVRELARAIMDAHVNEHRECDFCMGGRTMTEYATEAVTVPRVLTSAPTTLYHEPDCIVIRARALAGEGRQSTT